MKVYQMNDCDWFAAHSPGEAVNGYAQWLGSETPDRAVADGMIDNVIGEISLDAEIMRDLSEPESGRITLRQAIAEHAALHGDTPCLIASTEY
jgi:hypothetical protein